MTPTFAKVNPLRKLPALREIDVKTGEAFCMGESNAIMKYLIRTNDTPDWLFP